MSPFLSKFRRIRILGCALEFLMLLIPFPGHLLRNYVTLAILANRWIIGSPGLSPASGFEHPASTLPTRFPAALDIGHVLPAA